MNLDDNQKQRVRGWIDDGLKLADIQKKMEEELSLKTTYMELRFLIDDLKIMPKDPEPAPAKVPEAAAAAPEPSPVEAKPADNLSGVSVSVDTLARPGALVSGKVQFSDGKKAEWYLDHDGRLGLVAEEQGYRPPEADLREFQQQLQVQLQKMGM